MIKATQDPLWEWRTNHPSRLGCEGCLLAVGLSCHVMLLSQTVHSEWLIYVGVERFTPLAPARGQLEGWLSLCPASQFNSCANLLPSLPLVLISRSLPDKPVSISESTSLFTYFHNPKSVFLKKCSALTLLPLTLTYFSTLCEPPRKSR